MPGRTDNEIKNFWNSSIKKKLRKAGIDPNTHRQHIIPLEVEGATSSSNKMSNLNTPSILSPASRSSFPVVSELSKEPQVAQFVSDHEGTSSWQSSNSIGFFPSSQWSFSGPTSPVLCFSQLTGLPDMKPELNCITMATLLPSVSNSSVPNMNYLMPMLDMSSTVSLPQNTALHGGPFWEYASASNNDSQSNGKSTTTDLQDCSSMFEGSICNEAQLQLEREPEAEDFKWSEYLDEAFSICAAFTDPN